MAKPTIPIMHTSKRITSPKKLLNSKWTAVKPTNKEKHFMVTKLVKPDDPDAAIAYIELEAVFTKRVQTIAWQTLNDETRWLQGWQ